MAKLVWAFDIKPGADKIDSSIETGYTGGFLITPKKFPLCLTLRSADRERVIKTDFLKCLELLKKFKE